MRAVSPSLGAQQVWRLIDNDIALLSEAIAAPALERVAATTVVLDLSRP